MKKIIMPKVGLTMQSGIIERWLRKEGDYVEKGDTILEITTDKTNLEVEATDSGYIKAIIAKEGEEIPVNTIIAYLSDKNEVVSDIKKESLSEKVTEVRKNELVGRKKGLGLNISPIAKKLAEDSNIDLSNVKGTGPRGRILKEDILLEIESLVKQKKAGDETQILSQEYKVKVLKIIDLPAIKKLTGQRVKNSHLNAPPICLTLSCDMSKAKVKKDSIKGNQSPLTFTDIIVLAAAQALKTNQILNSTFRNDSIVLFDEINIGIATKTDKGLLVPVIKNVDKLSLAEISILREKITNKAHNGQLTLEDIENGTFTITNLGMFGIEHFEPIIVPNQAAILSVGVIRMTPVTDKSGQLVIIKPIMAVSVTCDHRIVDGADGAKFLSDFKKIIESV